MPSRAGSSCCVLAAVMPQSICMEPFCLCWHLTVTAFQRRLTLHFVTSVTRHYPLILDLLLVLLTMFYLLFEPDRLSCVSSLTWGKADITWPIHHSGYLDNLSADQNKTAVRNGLQDHWNWMTHSLISYLHPSSLFWTDNLEENRLFQLFLNFISLFNKLDCSSISRHSPRLVSMEYPGSEQIILWWEMRWKNAEWIWRRNNFGEPNYNPLSVFLRSKFHMCIICIKRRKQPEKGRNK